MDLSQKPFHMEGRYTCEQATVLLCESHVYVSKLEYSMNETPFSTEYNTREAAHVQETHDAKYELLVKQQDIQRRNLKSTFEAERKKVVM